MIHKVPIIGASNQAQTAVINRLQKHFKFDISDRVRVQADIEHFDHKEDESVWAQVAGKAVQYYEAYWDGVWICDFIETEGLASIELKFLQGFTNAYEAGQVHMVKPVAKKSKDPLKETKKKIEAMPEKFEEDRIVKGVLKEIVKEKEKKK